VGRLRPSLIKAVWAGVLLGSALCLPSCGVPPRQSQVAAAAGAGLDVALEEYQAAARSGMVGGIAGRVYAERAKPDGADTPLPEVGVILVPRSDRLLGDLEALKREARDSLAGYRGAAGRIGARLEAYRAALRAGGAADVVREVQVSADGTFRLDGVPAGRWLLFAARSVSVSVHGSAPPKHERRLFQLPPPVRGHRAITAWLRELTVASGAVESVELNDRNGWFTGMVEERGPKR